MYDERNGRSSKDNGLWMNDIYTGGWFQPRVWQDAKNEEWLEIDLRTLALALYRYICLHLLPNCLIFKNMRLSEEDIAYIKLYSERLVLCWRKLCWQNHVNFALQCPISLN